MATRRIPVTLPDEQVREIRELVDAPEAASISAFVQHTVRIALSDIAGWREMPAQALEQRRRISSAILRAGA